MKLLNRKQSIAHGFTNTGGLNLNSLNVPYSNHHRAADYARVLQNKM